MMNRHKKSPNFLFVINASILFTPHFIKEMKKMSEDSQILYQKSQNMAKSDFCSVVNLIPWYFDGILS